MKINNKTNNPKEKELTKPPIKKNKEKWSTPSIIELGVNNTLGGHIQGTTESYTGTAS